MPERAAAGLQHALAQNAAMRVIERERRVITDRADVAEMIGDALELGHHAAQHCGTRTEMSSAVSTARAKAKP